MREEILNLMKKGKELHQTLISTYSGLLPEKLIQGGSNMVHQEIPSKANVIINLLNSFENSSKFGLANTIDEAVQIFEDEQIEESINEAIEKEEPVYMGLDGQKLTNKEVIDRAKFGIESAVDSIAMTIEAGKLSKQNK